MSTNIANGDLDEQTKIEMIREYWNLHPFEYELSKSPMGTVEYFKAVEEYYAKKYSYLLNHIDYRNFKGKDGLDIGCGFGNNLVLLTMAGANITGIDISDLAIDMSKKNLELRNLNAEVLRKDGEHLDFEDNSFDFILAISVVSYTLNPMRMIKEIHRLLKKGSMAYFTVYNSESWLNFLLRIFNKKSVRENAPSFSQFTVKEFEYLLSDFSNIEITTDRYPFKTDRNNKLSTVLYNNLFVPAFGFIPKNLLKSYGHHIMAKAVK